MKAGSTTGGLARDRGLIESEEDCVEEDRGLVAWVGLELRMGVDDECCTDKITDENT